MNTNFVLVELILHVEKAQKLLKFAFITKSDLEFVRFYVIDSIEILSMISSYLA